MDIAAFGSNDPSVPDVDSVDVLSVLFRFQNESEDNLCLRLVTGELGVEGGSGSGGTGVAGVMGRDRRFWFNMLSKLTIDEFSELNIVMLPVFGGDGWSFRYSSVGTATGADDDRGRVKSARVSGTLGREAGSSGTES